MQISAIINWFPFEEKWNRKGSDYVERLELGDILTVLPSKRIDVDTSIDTYIGENTNSWFQYDIIRNTNPYDRIAYNKYSLR